jgi:hypothetical protein
MKNITLKYSKAFFQFTDTERELAKHFEVIVNLANKMIDESKEQNSECQMKKVSDMKWDLQRAINYNEKTKHTFSLDVKDDVITVLQGESHAITVMQKKDIFAVVKEGKKEVRVDLSEFAGTYTLSEIKKVIKLMNKKVKEATKSK